MKDQKGITGLETAIVLIAFVVVAVVFAFTVITTGLFSDTQDPGDHDKQVSATKITGDGYTKPRVKTMVEALPRDSSAPEGVDYLPDYLQDVFQKKVYVNPRVQALLVQHGTVDIRQLVKDLTSFAEEIGAR